MVGLEEIQRAAAGLEGVIRPTTTILSHSLSVLAGRPVYVKPEHLQRTGSFKIRGAFTRIAALAAAGESTEVVAASAGNHAQGVARAASLCHLRSTVFMPAGASLPKVVATRGYGADVRLGGESIDDAITAALDHSRQTGAPYVPPFDDPDVIAGQGTIGLELAHEAPDAEIVVVPVGGGGLVSGIAAALHALAPQASIFGVQAAGAAPMVEAMRSGRPVELASVDTMADGTSVRCVSQLTLDHVAALATDVVTVDEEEISRAVLVLLERCKWVVEPAGALGLAALLVGKVPGDGPVVVVLSGGNVDPLLLTRIIEHGLAAAGRYLLVRVVLPDLPGSLAALASTLGDIGLNLVTVEHRRFGSLVGVREAEVVVTVETRDPAHRERIVPLLREKGFRAETYG